MKEHVAANYESISQRLPAGTAKTHGKPSYDSRPEDREEDAGSGALTTTPYRLFFRPTTTNKIKQFLTRRSRIGSRPTQCRRVISASKRENALNF